MYNHFNYFVFSNFGSEYIMNIKTMTDIADRIIAYESFDEVKEFLLFVFRCYDFKLISLNQLIDIQRHVCYAIAYNTLEPV